MKDEIFNEFKQAKKENNLKKIRKLLYKTNDYNIRLEYAILCLKNKNYGVAKTEFSKLLNTRKKDIAILNLGRIAIKEKDYVTAKKYFKSIIRTYKAKDAEYELGRLELILKNKEKAKLHFLRSIEIEEDALAFYELGKIEIKAYNYEEAEKYLTKALSMKENDMFSKFELIRVKNNMGKFDESENLINELITLRKSKKLPVDSYIYVELVKCYLGKKQYKNARKILEEISKMNPNDTCIKYFYGILEFREKNYLLAKEYFEEILNIKYDASSEFYLGTTERLLGNLSSAEECLNNCLDKYKYKYQVLFELGMLEVRRGNLDKATNYLETAVSEEPIDKALYKALTLLYIKNKEFEKAACFIEKFPFIKSSLDNETYLYLSKKLNIFYKDLDFMEKGLSYSELQLLDYDEFVAVEYINENDKFVNDKEFNELDLYSLFIILKDKLKKKNKIERLSIMDVYVVKFNEILIKVITLPDTDEIISLYPIYDVCDIYNDEAVDIIDISKEMQIKNT